jgi:peptidoglycan hydrolase-like protein with peptidoglycan-binding domain
MLTKAVGEQAANRHPDVKLIQALLNKKLRIQSKPQLSVDGLFGPNTLSAIKEYQSNFMTKPDGVISPYGMTIKRLWPVAYSNPTGKGVRTSDAYGEGAYGASRGRRTHDGVDYISQVNQTIEAPLSGKVIRISRPYASGVDANVLEGVEIEASDGTKCWVWYIQPAVNIVNQVVKAGTSIIGKAKTLTNRYKNGITDHVHVRIHTRYGSSIDPTTVIK